MISRRNALKSLGIASTVTLLPKISHAKTNTQKSNIRFCLNTSTISGQKQGILKNIEIAGRCGYDGIELWIDDVKQFLSNGNKLSTLQKKLQEYHLTVENAIGFATWIVEDKQARDAAFTQSKVEMEMMAELGCKRIAAPPAGATEGKVLNLFDIANRYGELLELGVRIGVIPQLEIWGPSLNLSRLGQALFVIAETNHPEARILADVYHLYRGGSNYNGLQIMSGKSYEIFHMNDYPLNNSREELTDNDRIFPGDGVAPMKQIINSINMAGGTKVLSLELFNLNCWKRDPMEVASEGLLKMKKLVNDTL